MMSNGLRARRALLRNWLRGSSSLAWAPVVVLAATAIFPGSSNAQNVPGATANAISLLGPFLSLNSTAIGQQTLTADLQQSVLINQNASSPIGILTSPSQINPNSPSAAFLNGSQSSAAVAARAISDENLMGSQSNNPFGIATTTSFGPAANMAGGLPTQNTTSFGTMFNGQQAIGALGSVLGAAYVTGVNPSSPALPNTINLLLTAFNFTGNLVNAGANSTGDSQIAKFYFANGTWNGTNAAVATAGFTLPTFTLSSPSTTLPNTTNSVYDLAYGVTNTQTGQNALGDSHPYQTFAAVSSTYTLWDPTVKTAFNPANFPNAVNPGKPSTNPAFPSSHEAFAMTDGALLGMLVPQYYQSLLLRASEMGDSRIIVGVHYPTDIMGSRAYISYDLAQYLSNPSYINNPALTGTASSNNLSVNLPALFNTAMPELTTYLTANASACGGSITVCASNASQNPYAPSAANAQIYAARLTYGLPTYTFAQAPREQAPASGPDASILLATVYGGSTTAAKTLAPNGGMFGNLSTGTINQILVNTETDAVAAYSGTNLSYWTRLNLYDAVGYFGGVSGTVTLAPGDQLKENVTIASATTDVNGDTVPAGVLSGAGAINGNVLTQAGGAFAPGTGGTMTVSGTLTFQPGAIYSVGVNSTATTSANITGTAALGGNVVASIAPGTNPLHHYSILQTGGLNGTTFTAAGVSSSSPPNLIPSLSYAGGNVFLNVDVLAATHDLSGENKSDILWRDSAGNVATWLMNGPTIAQSKALGNVPNNWSIVSQRDFNGDGNSDILWRDTAGDVGLWLMNGSTIAQSALFTAMPANWSIVGTGDFNGDGNADILWRDTSGNLAIWLMNGTTIQQSATIGNVATSWVVAGADIKGDIFWRNASTGEIGMWVMNGTAVSKTVDFGAVPLTWTIAGIGDFDGNGSTDILWRDNLGNASIWLMNGTGILSTAAFVGLPSNLMIAETGDFNGDGKSDILWTDTSGNVSVWFMNGTAVSSATTYGNVGTAWTIQALNAD